MSRVIRTAPGLLEGWVCVSRSRMEKVANGQGASGTRLCPARSSQNDRKIGIRIDNGETFTKDGILFRRVKLQINEDADDPTLEKLANQDTHRVYAQADVVIGQTDKDEAIADMFGGLAENIKV
ncbi:hypothetical protein MMC25_004357 [Agyrium rufum]|nr:hypothetical protein [Agyrium rufum]